MTFTQEQVTGLIKIKNFLVEEGFCIHYPIHKNHPEEVIAVSSDGMIIVEVRTGKKGSIFMHYDNSKNIDLHDRAEKKTGITIFYSVLSNRLNWANDVKRFYSGGK